MMKCARYVSTLTAVALACAATQAARAQNSPNSGSNQWQPLSLAQAGGTTDKQPTGSMDKKAEAPMEKAPAVTEAYGFRGVSDFFNVREANPQQPACIWAVEFTGFWQTYSGSKHHDDDVLLQPGIRYGISDDVYAEINVRPINFFDGESIDGVDPKAKSGNGDLGLIGFWRFMRETDSMPAMALSTLVRVPTGYGSNKIDATFNLHATKTLGGGFRVNARGYVQTANGARGDFDREDIGDRRDFQWGIGPGVDYQLDDNNLFAVNYLNTASEYYGYHNSGIVEAGWVHTLSADQAIKVAVDAETHSERANGPHWVGKVQYTINFQ